MSRATGSGSLALLVFPGALVVYFAFNSGGMFELTTAFGALLVLTVILVCIASAREPLAGLSPLGAIACGALALFALWTLLSGGWSHSSGRALIAFDRALLYLAILALFACVPRTEARFRWLLRGLLVAGATVALIALISRVLPGWWPTTAGLVNDRLSYPLTYWNTFGLLVGMASILAVHHTCDEREPAAMRIFAAALLPPLGATLLLTFSRGAILVTVVGIVVYLIAARPYGFVGGFLAAAPPSAVALVQTYSADLIHEGTPLSPAAISEGKSLALTLFACAAGAALLRALTLLLDDRVTTLFSSSSEWRRGARIAGLACCLAILVAFLVAGGPGALNRQYHSFFENTDEAPLSTEGQRARLLEIGNDGRLPMWEVARDAYREDPLKGTGAGTFQLQWERHRNDDEAPRLYTYSLYLESLGELRPAGHPAARRCPSRNPQRPRPAPARFRPPGLRRRAGAGDRLGAACGGRHRLAEPGSLCSGLRGRRSGPGAKARAARGRLRAGEPCDSSARGLLLAETRTRPCLPRGGGRAGADGPRPVAPAR